MEDYYSKIVGEKGINIAVDIAPKTIPVVAGSVIIAIVISHFLIRGIYLLAKKS